MPNEFLNRFSNYSNVELLRIIKRPDDYQPDALKAAIEIIATRKVTDNDQKEVEEYYETIAQNDKKKREQFELLKKKANNLFEPILQPTSSITPSKWLNIFLLAVAAQFIWSFCMTIKSMISFYECIGCGFDITYLGSFLNLIYIPLVFYLFYKRNKWGWILLFGDNLFSVLSSLSQSYIFFKYQTIHQGDTGDFIWTLIIKSVFVVFLWREDIASYFNILPTDKKKYAFRIAGALLVLVAGLISLTMLT